MAGETEKLAMIHLEGMGLQGCLLAHRLHRHNVPFTWHDTDAEHTAWKASTGAIYPADSFKFGPDRECWEVWARWYEERQFQWQHLEESAGLVFCTKSPPHGGKYRAAELGNGLRRGQRSYHLNAQTFVPYIRERFVERRVPQAVGAKASHYVIAHGWGERLDYAYWGWTRLVELQYPAEWGRVGERPAFYFRPNRVVMAYAYPVPGTSWYYAGSSIIKQNIGAFKSLDAEAKYPRWKETFERLSKGRVSVCDEGAYIEGWRPAAAETDTAWARQRGRVITLRPLWNNGIRHFPRQWASIAPMLGL